MSDNNASTRPLPLPPADKSIHAYTAREWDAILLNWKRGWASESQLRNLRDHIEYQRKRIFIDRDVDGIYNWEIDWLNAKHVDDVNSDFVENRKTHANDVRAMWLDWCSRTQSGMEALSLEALRSMVLLNGAAILASLAVLSGQISEPTKGADIAARCTILFSVISLTMISAGHCLIFVRASQVSSKVRGMLVGNVKHQRLYAISRYLTRNLDPMLNVANGLIYGSLGVFALGSFVAAIILVTV